MQDRHSELEYKFKADHVPVQLFQSLMTSSLPDEHEIIKPFDDVFYKRGAVIVRHRQRGELTFKARKEADSIRDRVEINLKFSPETTKEDVNAFLMATGYERLFSLRKLLAQVFHFRFEHCDVEAVIYEVGRVDNWGVSGVRRFIEVELKNKTMRPEEAVSILDSWKEWFQAQLGVGDPLNKSLLEIYSDLMSPSTNYRI